MLISRELGEPYTVSDVKQYKQGVRTNFIWINHFLICVYYGDSGPEFGGVLYVLS